MWEGSLWDALGALPPCQVGKQPGWVLGSCTLWYLAAEQAAAGSRDGPDQLAGKAEAFAIPMGHFSAVKGMLQHTAPWLMDEELHCIMRLLNILQLSAAGIYFAAQHLLLQIFRR